MHYEYLRSTALRREGIKRRQISMLATAWLNCHLPASTLTLVGGLTGNRAKARLVRDLVGFVSDPTGTYNKSVFQWTLSYADPGIVRKLFRSVSKQNNDDWWCRILNQADPDLLLPREYTLPDYQVMWTSSAPPHTALVCFAGNALKLNIPVQLFHCVAARKFDLLIYLRDPKIQRYSCGIQGLGATMDEMFVNLRYRIPADCDVSVVGTSGGGLAAARFADRVHARRLALFSPTFEFNGASAIDSGGLRNVGAMKMFLAGGNRLDQKLHAQWQSNIADESIVMLDTDSHGTLGFLATTGRLDAVLDWLAGRTDSLSMREISNRFNTVCNSGSLDLQRAVTT